MVFSVKERVRISLKGAPPPCPDTVRLKNLVGRLAGPAGRAPTLGTTPAFLPVPIAWASLASPAATPGVIQGPPPWHAV